MRRLDPRIHVGPFGAPPRERRGWRCQARPRRFAQKDIQRKKGDIQLFSHRLRLSTEIMNVPIFLSPYFPEIMNVPMFSIFSGNRLCSTLRTSSARRLNVPPADYTASRPCYRFFPKRAGNPPAVILVSIARKTVSFPRLTSYRAVGGLPVLSNSRHCLYHR